MKLITIDTVDNITPQDFKKHYYNARKPLVIKHLYDQTPAFKKWNWAYFKQMVGHEKVPVYDNVQSDVYTPINKADGYMTFGEYLDLLQAGPLKLRIFAFNLLQKSPELNRDVMFPKEYLPRMMRILPFLFVGGQGSVTHMHFDIDMPNLLNTQFLGRKRVLLIPYSERHKLYRKPWEVLCLPNFTHYYDGVDEQTYPALKYVTGYDFTLEHGHTLYMPSGYFHHMEYLDPGCAFGIRAFDQNPLVNLKGLWNITAMRNIDALMKKTVPHAWYNYKRRTIDRLAAEAITKAMNEEAQIRLPESPAEAS